MLEQRAILHRIIGWVLIVVLGSFVSIFAIVRTDISGTDIGNLNDDDPALVSDLKDEGEYWKLETYDTADGYAAKQTSSDILTVKGIDIQNDAGQIVASLGYGEVGGFTYN